MVNLLIKVFFQLQKDLDILQNWNDKCETKFTTEKWAYKYEQMS